MSAGIHKAWAEISAREPGSLRASAGAEPVGGCFAIRSLGEDFILCPGEMEVRAAGPRAAELYEGLRLFFEHSVICYLAYGQRVGRTGRLIKPSSLPGGNHFFTRGTHVLPLTGLAGVHGTDPEGFIRAALALGGVRNDCSEWAVELFPVPPLPVTLILRPASAEFPASAELLFDSSAAYVAPLDVLWSSAMLVLGAMGAEVNS